MRPAVVMGFVLMLSACGASPREEDLDAFLTRVAAMPAPTLAPVPAPAPYEPFAYSASRLRSPFAPERGIPSLGAQERPPSAPDATRPRTYLEGFPLRTFATWGNGKAGPGARPWCGTGRDGFTAYPSGPT